MHVFVCFLLSLIQLALVIYPELGTNRQSQVGQPVVKHHALTQFHPSAAVNLS